MSGCGGKSRERFARSTLLELPIVADDGDHVREPAGQEGVAREVWTHIAAQSVRYWSLTEAQPNESSDK